MENHKLYKRDTAGKIRVWYMERDANRYRTVAGVLDGELVASEWTIATPKKGVPNPVDQAEREVKAEYKKKRDRGYFDRICDIDNETFFKPMLAHKYEKVAFPVISQPKLDGIRCIGTRRGLFSRQGKPITGVPHIVAALERYFEHDPDLVFDGELYNHNFKDDFNQITSLVRSTEPQDGHERIEYHVYDLGMPNRTFRWRASYLEELEVLHPLVMVPTETVLTQEELDKLYARYLEAGYEGQMVRLNGTYENKRSKNLLKRKEFLDGEFPVVAIEEGIGNWSGVAKRAVLQLPDGRQFGAGIRGTKEQALALLQGEKPKQATVRYFTPTPDGIPRFPVAVAFHGEVRL